MGKLGTLSVLLYAVAFTVSCEAPPLSYDNPCEPFGQVDCLTPNSPDTSHDITSISPTQAIIRWTDNSRIETGFRIRRALSGGLFSTVGEVGSNVTEFVDSTLDSTQKFEYQIVAFTDNHESSPSPTLKTCFTLPVSKSIPLPVSDTLFGNVSVTYGPGAGFAIISEIGDRDVTSIDFSPDGETLASGSSDGTVGFWEVNVFPPFDLINPDLPLIGSFTGHSDAITSVVFSPDGDTLASGSLDSTVNIWRVSDGGLVQTLVGHEGGVTSVAFNPNGETLASGSWDTTVKLWRVNDGVLIRTLSAHASGVTSVAFHPDGEILASGSLDKTVRLWRVSDGTPLQILSGHSGGVTSVAFSPGGETVASGSSDCTAKLWRVNNGTLIRTLCDHVGDVTSVTFSPDGERLATGSLDYTGKQWCLLCEAEWRVVP